MNVYCLWMFELYWIVYRAYHTQFEIINNCCFFIPWKIYLFAYTLQGNSKTSRTWTNPILTLFTPIITMKNQNKNPKIKFAVFWNRQQQTAIRFCFCFSYLLYSVYTSNYTLDLTEFFICILLFPFGSFSMLNVHKELNCLEVMKLLSRGLIRCIDSAKFNRKTKIDGE